MDLKKDELKIKVFHHHATFFFIRGVGVALAFSPFYFVASFFWGVMDFTQNMTVNSAITGIFLLYLSYDQRLYFLDRLTLTNKRIIHEDWKNIFKNHEIEIELTDIQNVKSEENGILSFIPLFNYGTLTIETSSSTTSIIFTESSNPDHIKDLIYHLNVKPNKIKAAIDLNQTDDQTGNRRRYKKEVVEGGRR